MRWLVGCCLLFLLAMAHGAAPQLIVPDGMLGQTGARVRPNVLLNLSLSVLDLGAAYRGAYVRGTEYAGYFNPRMCYAYPREAGYFSIAKTADLRHDCGGDTFSGNFLNWASTTTLDLLRYGLTGGDRVIDRAGLTVLQRAWLPDARLHPDFYAGDLFPPKQVSIAGGSPPSLLTPFDTPTLFVLSCRNRLLLSTSARRCDEFAGTGTSLGEFNARVMVCSEGDAASRPDLCRQYDRGNKPEGALQRHAGAIRVGVMGYLTEHGAGDDNLYGGVLRAPLKFLGNQRFDAPLFAAMPNSAQEWTENTGVLQANPDRAGGALSGAINYLNQLGRSNASRPGSYKTAEPGAELYYEALRYLQGREGSAQAGSGASDDGFPVWRSRGDPVANACQRQVILTIAHPHFQDDRFVPGNTRSGKKDAPRAADSFGPNGPFNVMESANRVGAMEADSGGVFANPAPRPGLRQLDTLDDGEGSYYLAGAAYWAHTQPIRPDKRVRVDSISLLLGENVAPETSALYLAAKYGAFDDGNNDGNPFKAAPGRAPQSEWSADGVHPDAWFSAGDGHGVIAAVRAAMARAAGRGGWQAGAAAVSMRAGGGFLMQSSFDPASWSGRLERIAIVRSREGAVELAAKPQWEAGALLTGSGGAPPTPSPSARAIYTLGSEATLPFAWRNLTEEQRAWLDLAPAGTMRDGMGEARLDWLRGERGKEGALFRRRASVLGDAMHSTPLLVGAPSPGLHGSGYVDFYRQHKARPPAIYLGTGDGMLHAFDARDGHEMFAYVPGALFPFLHMLTDPAYRHRPYADGSAGVADIQVGSTWRTVLVAGMGMGARGVFALDVTEPAAFGEGDGALWEFSEQDDPAIGHVGAPPQVARIQIGNKDGRPVYRAFAIVASGINNYGQDAMHADSGGALFLLALDKRRDEAWKRNVNYYRLAAPAREPGRANALGPVSLVIGGDGSARLAYAGDLQGRLWRFDFTGKPPFASAPVFEAEDADGRAQPISLAPRIAFAPGGGYLLLFGNGRLIEEADLLPSAFATQSFYAVRDVPPATVTHHRSDLAPRIWSGPPTYAVKGASFSYSGEGAKQGWFADFPASRSEGERLGASAVLASGTVFVNALVPGIDPCAAAGARSYVLDALTGFAFNADGAAVSEATTGQSTPPSAYGPLIFELDAVMGQRNATGGAAATRSIGFLHLAPDGQAQVQTVKVGLPARRMSWREIANWQELHDAATRK